MLAVWIHDFFVIWPNVIPPSECLIPRVQPHVFTFDRVVRFDFNFEYPFLISLDSGCGRINCVVGSLNTHSVTALKGRDRIPRFCGDVVCMLRRLIICV